MLQVFELSFTKAILQSTRNIIFSINHLSLFLQQLATGPNIYSSKLNLRHWKNREKKTFLVMQVLKIDSSILVIPIKNSSLKVK